MKALSTHLGRGSHPIQKGLHRSPRCIAVSIISVVASTLALCVLTPHHAAAWCQMTTDQTPPTAAMPCVTSGVPLSWRRRCMSFAVDSRGGVDVTAEEIEGVADRSFATWLAVTCDGGPPGFDIRGLNERSTCQEAEFREGDGNVNTVAFVSDWEARGYAEDAFAVTTVWHDTRTGEILDVDVMVNENGGPYAICPDTGCPLTGPGRRVVDLENIMTHELGHFFGIAHTTVPEATMFQTAGRAEIDKRTLAEDDITALCSIYPASILPLECDFIPLGGLDLNCEEESSRSGSCTVATPSTSRDEDRSPVWPIGLWVLAALVCGRWQRTR